MEPGGRGVMTPSLKLVSDRWQLLDNSKPLFLHLQNGSENECLRVSSLNHLPVLSSGSRRRFCGQEKSRPMDRWSVGAGCELHSPPTEPVHNVLFSGLGSVCKGLWGPPCWHPTSAFATLSVGTLPVPSFPWPQSLHLAKLWESMKGCGDNWTIQLMWRQFP
jgi:hypothetical protein